jgi:hypothetical protein
MFSVPRKTYPWFLLLLIPISILTACSRVPREEVYPVDTVNLTNSTEFVEKWYVCGPFPRQGSPALRQRWAERRDPISSSDLEGFLKESYETKEGKSGWLQRALLNSQMPSEDPATKKIRPLDVRIVDFLKEFPARSIESSAYALAFIKTNAAQTRTLMAGSDDGITIWLNGQQIHHVEKERPIVPDEDFTIAHFRPGLNTLVVEVTNAKGYWGFTLRMLATGKTSPSPGPLAPEMILR